MPGGVQTGAVLVQLGTPASPRVADVRRYLAEFLSDPRVIDLPWAARRLLLHGAILRTRPPRTAAAYRAIWSAAGSPLLVHSRQLAERVAERLAGRVPVELGMRYGEPSIAQALGRLAQRGVERVIAVPLFPQYAASSVGSSVNALYRHAANRWDPLALTITPPFPADPGFVDAVCEVARPELDAFHPDHVLFSFHGLPERQIRRSDASGAHCLTRPGCCDALGAQNSRCYRAHCFETARGIAGALQLADGESTVCFQSRLGRTPWIRPHTDRLLPELHAAGKRRIAVLCPSFVADCLETLEEVAIRLAAQWRELGGEALLAVPCVNASPRFVDTVAGWIERHV